METTKSARMRRMRTLNRNRSNTERNKNLNETDNKGNQQWFLINGVTPNAAEALKTDHGGA